MFLNTFINLQIAGPLAGSALKVFGDGVDYTESNAGIRMCLVFNADGT